MKKEEIKKITHDRLGAPAYHFYAVTKSGTLHICEARNDDFDENDEIRSFDTCKWVGKLSGYDGGKWKKRWTLYPEIPDRSLWKRTCRSCGNTRGWRH